MVIFFHNAPKILNHTMFSCKVVEFEGTYYINSLHNQLVRPQDIHELNKTRPVQASDYILRDLEVIVTREILNKEECYTLYFLADLTFFQNHTVVSCGKGETKVFCGDFRLIFDRGVIPHM